jgi:hypothetical protein
MTAFDFYKQLMDKQDSKGYWKIEQELIDAIVNIQPNFRFSIPDLFKFFVKGNYSNSFVATVLVIQILQTCYLEKQQTWKSAVEKAEQYLSQLDVENKDEERNYINRTFGTLLDL